MLRKPKTDELVSWKEFFRQWKKGMQEVTPLQQCVIIQFGQIVSLVGIIWGIVFSIRLSYWWMMVILIGGIILMGVQVLGNWQKKIILKEIEKSIKDSEQFETEVNNGSTFLVR